MPVSPRGPNERLIGVPGSRHMLGTPSLVLDLDVMEANIASMADHASAHGYLVRPVAKIHKSTDIARLQVAAGGLGPCCATLAESEAMVDAGMSGVMLFTSVVTEPKLQRLSELNSRAEDFVVVVDDTSNVLQLSEAARRSGKSLQLMVDIVVGTGRTGIASVDDAVKMARFIEDTDHLEFVGLQGYAGGRMGEDDYNVRRSMYAEKIQPLIDVVERLHEENLPPRMVSGGSTGSHDYDPEFGVLTEVQAGTYVFMDMNYENCVLRRDDPHPFGHSLFVRTTVISNARPGFVVTDAGLKEISNLPSIESAKIMSGAPVGSTYSLTGDDMGRIDFPSVEERMSIGNVVELMPPHCYQTAIMYLYYHVVRGDKLVDIWPVDAFANW